MKETFHVGIAGLGTVGIGVLNILEKHADTIAQRAGRYIQVSSVCARDKNKDRGIDLSPYNWIDNPVDLAAHSELDVIVELIGGEQGAAYDLVQKALKSKKNVVTANKALLAHHGYELASLADTYDTSLLFEASVAGGIPAIKTIKDGYAANQISAVYGILNGTCNYILTEMRQTGRDFSDVLKEAQNKGYAEADPTFDVDGIDAGHKIGLLAALAFGVRPDSSGVHVAGIRHIQALDIEMADELGYRIKLLGVAQMKNQKLSLSVKPWLVPVDRPLASVDGVYNAVFVDGDFVGQGLMTGRGAGRGPTASAVVADIIDLARGTKTPTFGVPADNLAQATYADPDDLSHRYYLRLNVLDHAGVLADISAILRDHDVSIETLVQRGRDPGQPVGVVITTHETNHGHINAACKKIQNLKSCLDEPCRLRIQG